MSAEAFTAALAAIVEFAKAEPEIEAAVRGVLAALFQKQDPTPALKHAQAIAEAIELGLDPKAV